MSNGNKGFQGMIFIRSCMCRESGQLMLWNNDYYGRIEEALGEHYAKKAARSHLAAIDYVEKV